MDFTEFSSETVTKLAKAMLNVQQQLLPVAKDAENAFVKSKYATLNAVMKASRDSLLANSIWVSQYPVPVEAGHLGLVTKLIHAESGEWQASCLVMPLPKADPQGYGSALTYARRYGLATMVGLVTELDDDAEAAMGRPRSSFINKEVLQRPTSVKLEQSQTQQGSPKASLSSCGLEDESLPKIDGVTYQYVQANNGRMCVTASGNTKAKRPLLKEAGFSWDDTRKLWWKYADSG